jgi:HD-like signal output (HDOD) protein
MTTGTSNAALRGAIERALQDMPALPIVVSKVLEETQKEHVNYHDLEKLLASDQALSAKTLRVVNSAYYGLAGQVSSIGQAVVILGLQQIRNLVLSLSALSMVKTRTERQKQIVRTLWSHSFGTAAGAQAIGRRKRFDSAECELLFLGGLMHDIGKLFLYGNFTETYESLVEMAKKDGTSLTELEGGYLGMSHPEVGRMLAERWRFPEALAELIGSHEGPFNEHTKPAQMVVHCADRLSPAGLEPPEPLDPFAAEWLGLPEAELEVLRSMIAGKVQAAEDFLGLVAAA